MVDSTYHFYSALTMVAMGLLPLNVEVAFIIQCYSPYVEICGLIYISELLPEVWV